MLEWGFRDPLFGGILSDLGTHLLTTLSPAGRDF